MVLYSFVCAVGKINMSHVKLIFWDLGGQQELQSLWDKVYIIMYMYSGIQISRTLIREIGIPLFNKSLFIVHVPDITYY